MSEINACDLAFVVDTTASMGPLIAAARAQLVAIIDRLSRAADVDLRVGIVEFRDHGPEDRFVYRVHPFSDRREQIQRTIDGLHPEGGGDVPEAVLDGVIAACTELTWRRYARRLAVLVGDAVPHGVAPRGDSYPEGCPCGETIESASAYAEETRTTVYALGLTPAVTASFTRLSQLTGGHFFAADQANQAIERLSGILVAEFGQLELDRLIMDRYRGDPALDLTPLAASLGVSRHVVATSLVRLRSRDLIMPPAPPAAAE